MTPYDATTSHEGTIQCFNFGWDLEMLQRHIGELRNVDRIEGVRVDTLDPVIN